MRRARQRRRGSNPSVYVGEPKLEKEWQAALVDAMLKTRWQYFHPYFSERSNLGYPDITAWRAELDGVCTGRVIFRELKRDGETPSEAQERTVEEINAAGGDAAIWYFPSMWDEALEDLAS